MSEHDKSDGLIIGILVVLVLLVFGGVGLVGFRFARVSQMAIQERDVAEMMRLEAMQQRDAAEAARLEADAVRAQMQEIVERASENGEPTKPAESNAKSDEPESKEQP